MVFLRFFQPAKKNKKSAAKVQQKLKRSKKMFVYAGKKLIRFF